MEGILNGGERLLERLASQAARTLSGQLSRQLQRVAAGRDREAVHDLRVAGRRLKLAFKIFEPLWPLGTGVLRDELGWMIRSCATLRDIEVFRGLLPTFSGHLGARHREALRGYDRFLSREIQGARKHLAAAFHSERPIRLVRQIQASSNAQLKDPQDLTRPFAGELLEAAFRKVKKRHRRAEANPSDRKFHRLRIALRNLSYQCEFFEGLEPVKFRSFIEKTVELQHHLGHQHDAVVALGLLKEHGTRFVHNDRVFLFSALKKFLKRRRKKAREAFFEAWSGYKRDYKTLILL